MKASDFAASLSPLRRSRVGSRHASPPSRARMDKVCFCRIEGCQNLLFGKATDYCHDQHRNLYHSTARTVGHRVITATGFNEAEILAARIVEMHISDLGGLKIKIQRVRPEEIDIDNMRPQERLGALCRAAERVGILPVR